MEKESWLQWQDAGQDTPFADWMEAHGKKAAWPLVFHRTKPVQ